MNKLEQELKSFEGLWRGGFFNNLHDPKFAHLISTHIKPNITPDTTILEIGCGRGSWTKEMLGAKHIYCLDALSAEHNQFWEYIGNKYKNKISYIHVKDFFCKEIPDNSIDFIFSYDTCCHISYSGMEEYMKNLYPKLKKGGIGYIMVADYEKYSKIATPSPTPGYATIEEEIRDFDGSPIPGRWYWFGVKRFCDLLVKCGYRVLCTDINVIDRNPITFFTKI